MKESGYLLSNTNDHAATRLKLLAAIFDGWTISHFDRIGLQQGWRCWEVGAGGPSILHHMQERIGISGYLLATDIDISRIDQCNDSVTHVKRHDVGIDNPPDNNFDLIHARLVLVHVPNRQKALTNMINALRPGGWLLIEDADPMLQPLACLNAHDADQIFANKIREGIRTLLSERGVDLAYGRKLPGLLRDAGLVEVCADAYFPVSNRATASLELATIELLQEKLIALGITTFDELQAYKSKLASFQFDLVIAPLISAWGRTIS